MNPDAVIAAARECLGAPFRHQGRSVRGGLDCAGLMDHVARRLGCRPIDVRRDYPSPPEPGLISRTLAAQPFLRLVPGDECLPGDILQLRIAGQARHLAIYTGDTIIHAHAQSGKCVEQRIPYATKAIIHAVYRFSACESQS